MLIKVMGNHLESVENLDHSLPGPFPFSCSSWSYGYGGYFRVTK